MKIVLDTNCLIPVLIPGSFGHDIWQAFRTGRYTLCVSTDILLEYEEPSHWDRGTWVWVPVFKTDSHGEAPGLYPYLPRTIDNKE